MTTFWVWASVLTVTQEFITFLAQTEWDPTETWETEKEEDNADNPSCIAKINTYICVAYFLAFRTLNFKGFKVCRHLWQAFLQEEQAFFIFVLFIFLLLILLIYVFKSAAHFDHGWYIRLHVTEYIIN